MEEYIRFKFDRAGKPLVDVIDQGGLEMIRARLTNGRAAQRNGAGGVKSTGLLHPLAINNLLTTAMNLAADMGAPKVTADVVKEV